MKHPFFKSLLVLGAALALINCSEENTAAPGNGEYVTPDYCWVLNADQTMLIYASGIVTDANGNTIGMLNETQTAIVSIDGTQFIVDNVNLGNLTILEPGSTVPESSVILPVSSSSVSALTPASSAAASPFSSATVQPPKSSAGTTVKSSNSQQPQQQQNSSTSQQPQQQQNSSTSQQQGGSDTCLDPIQNKQVPKNVGQTVNGIQYGYTDDCKFACWDDPNKCNTLTGGSGNNNQQTQPQQSSSSSAKSSSSQQQPKSSSSSQQQQQQGGGGNLLPKIIDNNKKTGYATRYWDSCKPHCAWEGKGGPVARTCNADGMSKASSDAKSVCDGGNAGTCFDQTPQIVNDTIAYAFAATPGGGNDCGKCYMLTFKGTGASATNTPTDDHHRKIKGKHLIVMSSNIGYDVSHNQFDLMIPGGGPGAFNGCGKMGISCAGAQYGGFLTTCNYNKDCLIKMCNSEYKNESLRNGCLFLANWMDAANNPEVEFVQVECPAALAAKY